MKTKKERLESKLPDYVDLIENHKVDKVIKKRILFKVKETIKRIDSINQ